MECNRSKPGAPTRFVVVKLGTAHALHAAGNYYVGVVGLHQHGGVENRLQTGGATPVQLVTGHLNWQACLQTGQPPDCGVLAGGITVAENDVVNQGWVDAAPFQGSADHRGSQLSGGYVAQAPAEVTDGSADWGNDGYSSHYRAPCSADNGRQIQRKLVGVSYPLPPAM